MQDLQKSNKEKDKQIAQLRQHIEKRDSILTKSINQTKELLINKVLELRAHSKFLCTWCYIIVFGYGNAHPKFEDQTRSESVPYIKITS